MCVCESVCVCVCVRGGGGGGGGGWLVCMHNDRGEAVCKRESYLLPRVTWTGAACDVSVRDIVAAGYVTLCICNIERIEL